MGLGLGLGSGLGLGLACWLGRYVASAPQATATSWRVEIVGRVRWAGRGGGGGGHETPAYV